MNIIYLLTNTNKTEGTRYYIGSKTECSVIEIDSINTIISLNTDKPYYGSSSNINFHNDLKNGHVFDATILEVVTDRSTLLERENYFINQYKAVESTDYYNLSQATLGGYSYDQKAIKNIFGETIKGYAQNESSSSKRRSRAKELGFSNYGEMAFDFYKKYNSGLNYSQIGKIYGVLKSYPPTFLSKYDMEKASIQLDNLKQSGFNEKQQELRALISKGASLKKAAELLNIEEPVAEILNNGFSGMGKNFSVALLKGLTPQELGKQIFEDLVYNDLDHKGCAEKQGLTITNVNRYLIRYLKTLPKN